MLETNDIDDYCIVFRDEEYMIVYYYNGFVFPIGEELEPTTQTTQCRYAGYITNNNVLALNHIWEEAKNVEININWIEDGFILCEDIIHLLSIVNRDTYQLLDQIAKMKKIKNHYRITKLREAITQYQSSPLINIMVTATRSNCGLIYLCD
jgi:hypothetical protein